MFQIIASGWKRSLIIGTSTPRRAQMKACKISQDLTGSVVDLCKANGELVTTYQCGKRYVVVPGSNLVSAS